ncbi:MAG: RNA polymerase sigma factor [Patescibacteria group bacterium]|jgi:RNA polymerase sigma-70 factor (ECF subfamily)
MEKNYKNFSRAFNNYAPVILKHIFFRVSSWEVAQDLTQEAFFKTWQYLTAKKTIRDYKKFIYMVANNLVIDHYRKKDKLPVSIEKISPGKMLLDAAQEKEIDQSIELENFKEELAKLKPGYREIITYRYFKEMSIEEISRLTGRSKNNISVMIHRGMKTIKNNINNKK